MKGRWGIPWAAWVLLGFLALSAGLLSLGQRDDSAYPSALSYGPSGTHALQELLQDRGYVVKVSTAESPALEPTDLVIAFYLPEHAAPMQEEDPATPINAAITKHLRRGGKVLAMPLQSNFPKATKAALAAPRRIVSPLTQQAKSIHAAESFGAPRIDDPDGPTYALWKFEEPIAFAEAGKVGPGTEVILSDGLLATNRFIDRADNAEVLMSLIAGLAPRGGRIVLTEATFGNTTGTSLVGTIGPWAEAAWKQTLLLFAVIILTLGTRFGLADERRTKERGQRELLDAVADTYQRGHMTRVALSAAYDDVDAQIRKALKLPRGASISDRDRLLPEDLVKILHSVHEQMSMDLRSRDAAALAERLYANLGEFLLVRSATNVKTTP